MTTLIFLEACLLSLSLLCSSYVSSNFVELELDASNIDRIINETEIVLINFYENWCPHSMKLKKHLEGLSELKRREYSNLSAAIGAVNCDTQTQLCDDYNIYKYPTIKLFRYGKLMKKEYRGKRNMNQIIKFVTENMQEPITEIKDIEEIQESNKGAIIGYFKNHNLVSVDAFRREAVYVMDYCNFYGIKSAKNEIVFKPPGNSKELIIYKDSENLESWIAKKCIPEVREMTLENAADITDENLPLIILFRDPTDIGAYHWFKKLVESEFYNWLNSFNFVYVNGFSFTRPLEQLGLTGHDLPVVLIDTFVKMHLFTKGSKEDFAQPGKLKKYMRHLKDNVYQMKFHDNGTISDMKIPEEGPISAFGTFAAPDDQYSKRYEL